MSAAGGLIRAKCMSFRFFVHPFFNLPSAAAANVSRMEERSSLGACITPSRVPVVTGAWKDRGGDDGGAMTKAG